MIIEIIILAIIAILYICGNIYINREKIKLEKLKLYNSIDFEAKYELLNKMIIEELDDYKILNFTYRENEVYITEDMQKDMINKVTTKVIERTTDAIKSNLKLVYNISSDEDLINIIGRLVSLQVLAYSIDINSIKDDE